jgi:hypothetical protein
MHPVPNAKPIPEAKALCHEHKTINTDSKGRHDVKTLSTAPRASDHVDMLVVMIG